MNCSRFIKIRVCLKFRANLQKFLWYWQLLVLAFYSTGFRAVAGFAFSLLYLLLILFGITSSYSVNCWAFTGFALLVQVIIERYVKLLSNISFLSFISWCCCYYWLWWSCYRGCYYATISILWIERAATWNNKLIHFKDTHSSGEKLMQITEKLKLKTKKVS